jgi:hypothetical protein
VSEIERELKELSAWIDFPPGPSVLPALRDRIARRRRRARAGLALVLALVVAGGAVLASSPSARSSILRWMGIEGVELERVPRLPATVTLAGPEAPGRRVTLARAAAAARFGLRLPHLKGLGAPDRVYLDRSIPDGLVSFVWGTPAGPRLLLSEWRGDTKAHFHKLVQFSVKTRRVRIESGPGIWVSGPPHAVFFRDALGYFSETQVRLAGNVLIWMRGDLSYRLEADVRLADAVTIAESLRPNE